MRETTATAYSMPGRLGPHRVIVGGRPALEQGAAAVDLEQPLHLFAACVEIVLEHLDIGVDFLIRAAARAELMRSGQDSGSLDPVFDVEFVENARHRRFLWFERRIARFVAKRPSGRT